jgi:ADP-ribose pyrophosphatase
MNDRIVNDEIVHSGPVAEVHAVQLRMPDGQVVGRDLIHYSGAAVILPLLEDGSMVFVRNYRFALDEYLLELPAGMLEPGEPPLRCAHRELAEETGYAAAEMTRLGSYCSAPGTSDEVLHAFLATDLTAGEPDPEGHEQISVEQHGAEDVRAMILDGRIHDAKTIAALCLYWLGRGQ